MPHYPVRIILSPQQAAALVHVAGNIDLAALFPDFRRRGAAERAFDRICDTVSGIELDGLDVDLDRLGHVLSELRSTDMVQLIGFRVRDLLSVCVLWSAVEKLSGLSDAQALLGVPLIDSVAWRAEVVDLLESRGIEVELPGEVALVRIPLPHGDESL